MGAQVSVVAKPYQTTVLEGLHGFMNPHDFVADSCWIVSIAMVAPTPPLKFEGLIDLSVLERFEV